MMSATWAPAAMAPTRTRTKVCSQTSLSGAPEEKRRCQPFGKWTRTHGTHQGQCIDARKKAALGGTAWILLKAAVSPRTRPFPEPAPRRG